MLGLHQHHMSYSPAASQAQHQQQVASGKRKSSKTSKLTAANREPLLLVPDRKLVAQHFVQVPAQTHALPALSGGRSSSMVLLVPKCGGKSRSHPMNTVSGLCAPGEELQAPQMAPYAGELRLRGEHATGAPSSEQVLLIVEEANQGGAGVPVIGRRLPSKSAGGAQVVGRRTHQQLQKIGRAHV